MTDADEDRISRMESTLARLERLVDKLYARNRVTEIRVAEDLSQFRTITAQMQPPEVRLLALATIIEKAVK